MLNLAVNKNNNTELFYRDSLEFKLEIGYNDVNCDVSRDAEGRFATDVIIQHHDMVVTSSDIGNTTHSHSVYVRAHLRIIAAPDNLEG